MKKTLQLLLVASLASIAGCESTRQPLFSNNTVVSLKATGIQSDRLASKSSPKELPQLALLPTIAVTSKAWHIDTNKVTPARFQGLKWTYYPTNGPIFFRIWMATNVTGPWTIIDTNLTTQWPDVFSKHTMPTQKITFFHVTAFSTGLQGMTNYERDSGWITTNK